MTTIDDLTTWVNNRNRDHWDMFVQGNEAPDEQDVARVEADLGFRLPDEVRALALHPMGGLLLEAKDDVWPRGGTLAVGPTWSFQYGLQVYSLSGGAPDWLQMMVARDELEGIPDDATPVLKVAKDPAPWVVTAEGKFVKLLHGSPLWDFDGSFLDLVMDEISQLEERLRRRLAREGL